MCEFWSDQHRSGKGDLRISTTRFIRKHALGNPQLLAAQPAMLWHLDGRANVKTNPDEKPNENYARELMELHARRARRLRNRMEVARCLAAGRFSRSDDGYSGKPSPLKGAAGCLSQGGHDDGASTCSAGYRPASQRRPTRVDCRKHPALQFIATKLCVRFISDDRPPGRCSCEVIHQQSGRYQDDFAALAASFISGLKFKRPFTTSSPVSGDERPDR
jgi:uncharacterized protein (DUF1800 family)